MSAEVAVTRERPILFSGEMVRAILDGRKTQTRRIARVTRVQATGGSLDYAYISTGRGRCVVVEGPASDVSSPDEIAAACPYGAPGDRLWVRETWRHQGSTETVSAVRYAADEPAANPHRWSPSIFMPRWASRLSLGVVERRFERLQSISEEDARAEGFDATGAVHLAEPARAAFALGWDRINGKRGPWASNPGVWAITFRRL